MKKSMLIACLCFIAIVSGTLILAHRIMLPTLSSVGLETKKQISEPLQVPFYRTVGGFHHQMKQESDDNEKPLIRSQFTLEVVKVKSQAEAEKWLLRLEKSGLSAFYTPIHAGTEVIFRVRSGLFSQEQSAKLAQKNIREQHRIETKVVGL